MAISSKYQKLFRILTYHVNRLRAFVSAEDRLISALPGIKMYRDEETAAEEYVAGSNDIAEAYDDLGHIEDLIRTYGK